MTTRQRIALLAIAAVVLVAGIALAAGSGGDEEPEPTAGTTTAVPEEANPVGGATQPRTQEEAPPPPRVETIRMKGRAPVGEARTLRYERGDTIRLRFTSDVAEEIHVHGFDEYVDVPAGNTPKTARFKADLEGIFEVEAHSSGEILAKLEIRPK